jgi:hypothetical protein
MALLKSVYDKRPWTWNFGASTQGWDSVAEDIPTNEDGIRPTGRSCHARFDVFLGWAKQYSVVELKR